MPPRERTNRTGRREGRDPVQRLVSSGGLVIRHGDSSAEVALIRHRTLRGRLAWTFPKGSLEDGESIEEAALREVREETGLDAEIVHRLPDVTYWFSRQGARYRKTVHLFLMRMVGGDTAEHDSEVEEVRFFPLDDAQRLATYVSEKRILGAAADLVAAW